MQQVRLLLLTEDLLSPLLVSVFLDLQAMASMFFEIPMTPPETLVAMMRFAPPLWFAIRLLMLVLTLLGTLMLTASAP